MCGPSSDPRQTGDECLCMLKCNLKPVDLTSKVLLHPKEWVSVEFKENVFQNETCIIATHGSASVFSKIFIRGGFLAKSVKSSSFGGRRLGRSSQSNVFRR